MDIEGRVYADGSELWCANLLDGCLVGAARDLKDLVIVLRHSFETSDQPRRATASAERVQNANDNTVVPGTLLLRQNASG